MPRVLLVDDDAGVRASMAALLEGVSERTMEVQEAENGAEALEALKRELPEVLITDIEMPVLDGMGLAGEIRRQGWAGKMRVVVVSSEADDFVVRRAFSGIACGFLRKPFAPLELLELIAAPVEEAERP